MSERAAYSRVYWTVMDDPKFDGIRENVRHFGSWSLLLVVADMAWPAPAFVPSTVPKPSYRALVECGLVDSLSGGRFRLHGLDAERGRRRDAARAGTKRDPSGTQTGPSTEPNGSLDEGETRRDETRTSRGNTPALTVIVDYIEKRSGRPWQSRPGSKLWDTLSADLRDHGDRWLSEAEEVPGDRPDHGQLIFGVTRRLHPIAPPTATSTNGGHTRTAKEVDDAFSR